MLSQRAWIRIATSPTCSGRPPPSTAKLTEDDVREALRFAAVRVDERTITLDQTA